MSGEHRSHRHIEREVQSLRRRRRDKVHLKFYLFLRPYIHDVPTQPVYAYKHQETIYLHRKHSLYCKPPAPPHYFHTQKSAAFGLKPMLQSASERNERLRRNDHDRSIASRLGQAPAAFRHVSEDLGIYCCWLRFFSVFFIVCLL